MQNEANKTNTGFRGFVPNYERYSREEQAIALCVKRDFSEEIKK
jgi:hypothetical protein